VPKSPVVSIVDDDMSVRAAVATLVRSLGFTARSFASAAEFLHSSSLAETACLVSDVQMPDMDGLALQGELIARGCRIPVVFITAFPNERLQVRAAEAGAICFLHKPFEARAMIGCIAEAMKLSS
jgi:FixJ family two-component response regulator